MKTLLSHKHSAARTAILAAAAAVAIFASPSALRAQGRGAPVPPPSEAMSPRPAAMSNLMTVGQQAALDAIVQAVAGANTAATSARQALVAASLTLPRNDVDIRAKAAALGEAETALAVARVGQFAQLQAGPDKFPESQRAAAVARLSGAGGGRGGLMQARMADDMTGFRPIFDGTTLTGWEGDTKFWRAEGGKIVGESTPENRVSVNTFLIWRGAIVKDFELKAEFRINGTNSGIQYRSREVPTAGPYVLSGYQADMDIANQYTGGLGEERGRSNVMVPRGQMIRLVEGNTYKFLGTLGDPAEIGGSFVPNGWNTYHIIVRGPVLIHILNGRVSAVMIDEDDARRATEGVIGLQMHTGDPFKVEYRNVMYKAL